MILSFKIVSASFNNKLIFINDRISNRMNSLRLACKIMRGQFLSILSKSGYKLAANFYIRAAWFPITNCFTYFHLRISWSFFLKLLSSSARSGDSGNSASSRTLEYFKYTNINKKISPHANVFIFRIMFTPFRHCLCS